MPFAVGHLDADCFYVNAERVRYRDLDGKPVAVLGNQGACVIAKSYEMKRLGVKTGEPIWDARKKCPDGVYVKRDFRWYEVLSRGMLDVLTAFSPRVEYYSIDEFFFAVPAGDFRTTAEAIRDRVWETCRLPVTVGVGRTRTLAKLFAEAAKPFGALAVTHPDEEAAMLARLPVTEVSGIAGRRAARLAPYGIRTCLDFRRASGRLVRQLLTKTGEDLWAELNGSPAQPIRADRVPHQTVSRGGSLGGATGDPAVLWAWCVRNLERLIEELEFHDVRAGRLTVWLSHKGGPTGVGDVSFDCPTDRFDTLLDGCRDALRQAWVPGAAATHMHLIASKLGRSRFAARSLFERADDRAHRADVLKRQVNRRVGRFAVRSGATLPLKAVYDDPSNGHDICDVRGKVCF
jgi:DNA polymerase V